MIVFEPGPQRVPELSRQVRYLLSSHTFRSASEYHSIRLVKFSTKINIFVENFSNNSEAPFVNAIQASH